MLKRNLQVMKLKKVIFPLKILKMQEINMEKSLQMLKKILASQVDFKNQKPLLQEIIEAKDHRVFDSIPLKYANCHVIYFFDCIFVMKVIKKSLKNFPEFDTCGAVTWWLIMLRTVQHTFSRNCSNVYYEIFYIAYQYIFIKYLNTNILILTIYAYIYVCGNIENKSNI